MSFQSTWKAATSMDRSPSSCVDLMPTSMLVVLSAPYSRGTSGGARGGNALGPPGRYPVATRAYTMVFASTCQRGATEYVNTWPFEGKLKTSGVGTSRPVTFSEAVCSLLE